MNYHTRYAGLREPIEACLVGGGAFGQSFLTQARFIKMVSARIAIDLTVEAAGRALEAAGFPKADIRICTTPAEARAAFDSGFAVASEQLETVIGLPFHILVEATGHPEAAASHARLAISAKRHVLLVTKETDSVIGPILAKLARDNGVNITPVDGDQPSLLIDLVTWAETLGFDILCAGKSSEYDFVFDAASGRVISNGIVAELPAMRGVWSVEVGGLRERARERAHILGAAFPLRAVPDLCEMTLVANATGLGADTPPFHMPVARVPEVAELFSTSTACGLLSGKRRLDVFHHLRAPEEASFAGGVFVTIACQDRTSWQVLAEKGHVVSLDGASAMIYLPRHLLGIEAATSILDLAGLGVSGYGDDYRPNVDLVAVATRDLSVGDLLTAKGHHHTIDGVGAEMRPMSPISADRTTPYYLVANRKLARPVRAGEAIRLSDLEITPGAALIELRMQQDKFFAGE